jgi:uncharacterized protein (UPF0305 family)
MSISFNKGYRQIAPKYRDAFIKRIMRVLNVKTVQSFYDYKKGLYEPKLSQAKSIEKIFASYGITDVWGKR